MPAATPNDRIWFLCCAAAYLALCAAHAAVWEPAHDEGVTFTQAIGRVSIGRPPAAAPVPVSELYAAVGAERPHGAGDVVAALMRNNGMHPPAYYLGLHAWTRLAGTRRLALGLPAYACGLLALFAMRGLGERVAGRGAGRAAMLLLALSPWFAGFSNYARPYALAVCLTIFSSVAALEFQGPGPRAGWRIAFVLLSLLGLYSLYHYVFVVLWQGALVALCAWRLGGTQRTRALGTLALLGALVLAGFAPWIPNALRHLEATGTGTHYFSGSLPPAEWAVRSAGLLERFALGEGFRSAGAAPLRALLAGLALVTAALLIRSFRVREADAKRRLFWLSLPILPGILLAADLWHGTHTLLHSKTAFALLPPLLLAIVRAWHAAPSRRLRAAGVGAWAALFVASSLAGVHARAVSLTDFEAVARSLARADREDHVLVLSSNHRGYTVPLLLTLRTAGVARVRVVSAPAAALDASLASLLGDPGVDRLTLLDLAVPYQRSGRWSEELLESALAQGRASGWHALRRRPRAPGAESAEPRSLVIWSPVETVYFGL